MKDRKTQFRYFTIMDYEKEGEYLRQMHKQGWKFTGISGMCFYKFEACEPEDVVYQLDYNEEGISHKEEYVKMFEDCGWEYLMEFVGYSYFRKPVSEMQGNEDGIFCDDNSRWEMLKRVFRGRLIPLILIFCGLVFFSIRAIIDHGIHSVDTIGFLCIVILYLVIFIASGIKALAIKKKISKDI
ncbi:MAG: DUF2812 domain-containing protein [Lachnospiraceae bacterium]|nr:DUF2812 domain-containing protein [Lachnospiraceae bacterium]